MPLEIFPDINLIFLFSLPNRVSLARTLCAYSPRFYLVILLSCHLTKKPKKKTTCLHKTSITFKTENLILAECAFFEGCTHKNLKCVYSLEHILFPKVRSQNINFIQYINFISIDYELVVCC